jgi:hypothetical protein
VTGVTGFGHAMRRALSDTVTVTVEKKWGGNDRPVEVLNSVKPTAPALGVTVDGFCKDLNVVPYPLLRRLF